MQPRGGALCGRPLLLQPGLLRARLQPHLPPQEGWGDQEEGNAAALAGLKLLKLIYQKALNADACPGGGRQLRKLLGCGPHTAKCGAEHPGARVRALARTREQGRLGAEDSTAHAWRCADNDKYMIYYVEPA